MDLRGIPQVFTVSTLAIDGRRFRFFVSRKPNPAFSTIPRATYEDHARGGAEIQMSKHNGDFYSSVLEPLHVFTGEDILCTIDIRS